MLELGRAVEAIAKEYTAPVKVAVMGCVVNGPGESTMADVGVAGGKGKGAIYRRRGEYGGYVSGETNCSGCCASRIEEESSAEKYPAYAARGRVEARAHDLSRAELANARLGRGCSPRRSSASLLALCHVPAVEMVKLGRQSASRATYRPSRRQSDKESFVFAPIRTFAEALGAQTSEVEDSGRIDIVRGSESLRARVGDVRATVNGVPLTLAHAPFRVRGRIMDFELKRPLRRAFNVRARYDRAHRPHRRCSRRASVKRRRRHRLRRLPRRSNAVRGSGRHAISAKPSGSSTGTTFAGSDLRKP